MASPKKKRFIRAHRAEQAMKATESQVAEVDRQAAKEKSDAMAAKQVVEAAAKVSKNIITPKRRRRRTNISED